MEHSYVSNEPGQVGTNSLSVVPGINNRLFIRIPTFTNMFREEAESSIIQLLSPNIDDSGLAVKIVWRDSGEVGYRLSPSFCFLSSLLQLLASFFAKTQ